MKMTIDQIKKEMWDLKEKDLRGLIQHAKEILSEINDIRVQFNDN